MRKAREAQDAAWDDAWDALAAAKAEAEEERKAQARQEQERKQAEQHARATRASAGSSSDTATATADGIRSRVARAEARQAKRPRDEGAAHGEPSVPDGGATAVGRGHGEGVPASLDHGDTAMRAASEKVRRLSGMSDGEGDGVGQRDDAVQPEGAVADVDGDHRAGRAISSSHLTTAEPAECVAAQAVGEMGAGSMAGEASDTGGAAGERGSGAYGDGREQSPADQAEHNNYESHGHSQTCGDFRVHVNNNDIAANAASTAPNRQLSFIAFRNVRAGLVWVDELFTAREWREMGVARWLMWHAAEGRRVELQVLSGQEGEGARRAYTGMGMHRYRTVDGEVLYGTADGQSVLRCRYARAHGAPRSVCSADRTPTARGIATPAGMDINSTYDPAFPCARIVSRVSLLDITYSSIWNIPFKKMTKKK